MAYDQINLAVAGEEIDFLIANPSTFMEQKVLHGVTAIATMQNLQLGKPYTVFGSVIFSRAGREDITTLEDIKGKSFAAADENSFGGWRIAWLTFKEHHIDPYRDFASLSFAGTHDAVVYAVQSGEVDAGTVRTDTLERMAMEGKIVLDDFKGFHTGFCEVHHIMGSDVHDFPLLLSTALYPEWPFTKIASTSNELADLVAVALLAMPADCPAAQARESRVGPCRRTTTR